MLAVALLASAMSLDLDAKICQTGLCHKKKEEGTVLPEQMMLNEALGVSGNDRWWKEWRVDLIKPLHHVYLLENQTEEDGREKVLQDLRKKK